MAALCLHTSSGWRWRSGQQQWSDEAREKMSGRTGKPTRGRWWNLPQEVRQHVWQIAALTGLRLHEVLALSPEMRQRMVASAVRELTQERQRAAGPWWLRNMGRN
jgi:hypothetical protein